MANSVSREKRVQIMFDMMLKGVTERKDILTKFYKKVKVSPKTFDNYYKIASQRFLAHQEAVNLQRTAEHAQLIAQGQKTALKSKIERLSEKQADVDRLRAIAYKGTTMDVYFEPKTGVPMEYERAMTTGEIANILKRATEIEAEISKIEGDYAATKHLIRAQVFTINIEASDGDEADNYQLPEVE